MEKTKVLYCSLCDVDGHVPGKDCLLCCSNCGGERDQTGYCSSYCMDEYPLPTIEEKKEEVTIPFIKPN